MSTAAVIADINHEVLAAMISAAAVLGASITTGLFVYLSAKVRNGKAEVDKRLDLIERALEENDA